MRNDSLSIRNMYDIFFGGFRNSELCPKKTKQYNITSRDLAKTEREKNIHPLFPPRAKAWGSC